MEVVIQPDAAAVAVFGADIIGRLVSTKPEAVLGLATGSSPLGLYGELVRRCAGGSLTFHGTTVFLLDEYIGLPAGHPCVIPRLHRAALHRPRRHRSAQRQRARRSGRRHRRRV